MTPSSAEKFLQNPPARLAALYVVFGAEPLAALDVAEAIRARARAEGYSEREVLTAEPGFDWSRLLASGNTLSLFASRRLLELRIPTGKPGREGSAAIESFCARLPEDTITLVLLPELDWQVRQGKWFAALCAAGTLIEAMPVERARLPAWLAGRLALQQQSMNEETLEHLADRVEGNLLAAQQEIRKLALLCPPGQISRAMVDEAVADVSRFDVFQLPDALAAGDAPRLVRMLDGLKAEGEAPPLVLWVLVNELRLLARAMNLTRAGRAPFPAKARSLEALARRHSARSVRALFLKAAHADRAIKGLESREPWGALEALALAIAGHAWLKAA
ncbi:MAG TPA: DNA polymerase III subunit delta [Usitatibacteraceae bacterium]|nr:DNA polymerase III subunit delta [Usitatibacteraceae bacterium]